MPKKRIVIEIDTDKIELPDYVEFPSELLGNGYTEDEIKEKYGITDEDIEEDHEITEPVEKKKIDRVREIILDETVENIKYLLQMYHEGEEFEYNQKEIYKSRAYIDALDEVGVYADNWDVDLEDYGWINIKEEDVI